MLILSLMDVISKFTISITYKLHLPHPDIFMLHWVALYSPPMHKVTYNVLSMHA